MSYIDTRDLIKETQDLETLVEEGTADEEDLERLAAIRDLSKQGIEEWDDGATLIPEDDFEDYARELAEDIGAIPDDASWPITHIDWEQAADELRMDYTLVTFDGTDYLVR